MFKSLRRWGRLPDFEAVLNRFPVAVACMALLTLFFMFEPSLRGMRDIGIVMGLILAGYLCVLIQLSLESRNVRVVAASIAKLGVAIAAVLLSTFFDDLAFFPPAAIAGAIVFLGNAAFLSRARDDLSVWLFTQRLWTGAIFAFVGSVVFALGVMAIYAALNQLFGIEMQEVVTRLILPIGLAFLAPVYWMGTLPDPHNPGDGLAELSFEARALAFLGTWLLAPLTLIYGVILLAYAVKILLTWSLPSNEIGWLVTPFLIAGTLTWLVLEPSVLKPGGIVRLFRRVWFPIMAAATVLLAIAIGVRVAEYGLTPERVGMLSIVAAALAMSLWFTLSKRRDIRIPTAVAAGFLVAASFLAKPLADLQQYRTLRAALANVGETVESEGAYRAMRYLLFDAGRRDWVADALGVDSNLTVGLGAEPGWQGLLAERGVVLPEGADELATFYGRVSYEMKGEVGLGDYNRFIQKVDIRIQPASETGLQMRQGEYIWRGSSLHMLVNGREMSREIGTTPEDLYARLRLGFQDDAAMFRRQSGHTDLPPDERYMSDFVLPNGREVRLVITEFSLNGEGETLGGGYGQGLLFGK